MDEFTTHTHMSDASHFPNSSFSFLQPSTTHQSGEFSEIFSTSNPSCVLFAAPDRDSKEIILEIFDTNTMPSTNSADWIKSSSYESIVEVPEENEESSTDYLMDTDSSFQYGLIKIENGDDEYFIKATDENYNKDYQCNNCEAMFTESDFLNHICDFDKDQLCLPKEPLHVGTEATCLFDYTSQMQRTFIREQCKVTPTHPSENFKSASYLCNLCGQKFNSDPALQRHHRQHCIEMLHSQSVSEVHSIVKCMKCGEVFSKVQYADEHYDEKHPTDDNTIITDDNYLRVIVASVVYQCECCDCVFTQLGDLFHHTSLHCSTKSYACTNCDIKVKTLKEIQQHWQKECISIEFEPEKTIKYDHYFACNVCNETFPRVDILHSHRNATLHFFPRLNHKTNQVQVGCEICGEVFGASKDFLEHQVTHKVREPTVSRKRNIKSTKPGSYLCELCGKSYTQSSHLWQHLRFHKRVKPFKCPEQDCGRRFTIRPDLDDHIRKCHTFERPYQCFQCGKRFLTGSVYYRHHLIHSGERRHTCECGKKFYRADALKNHQRIHSGEKPYSCTHCNKAFRQRGDLKKHIRARHKFLLLDNVENFTYEMLTEQATNQLRKNPKTTTKSSKSLNDKNKSREVNLR